MHCVSSGLQDQVLLFLDIIVSLEKCERSQKCDNSQFPIFLGDRDEFFIEMYFFWIPDGRANNEQSSFFGTESNLKGLPLTSKAASGYLRQSVWYWTERSVPSFEKIRPDTNNRGFT